MDMYRKRLSWKTKLLMNKFWDYFVEIVSTVCIIGTPLVLLVLFAINLY